MDIKELATELLAAKGVGSVHVNVSVCLERPDNAMHPEGDDDDDAVEEDDDDEGTGPKVQEDDPDDVEDEDEPKAKFGKFGK